MVNDLLDLSRMEAGMVGSQRSRLSLEAVAHEVYEAFHIRAARAEVTLSLDAEENLPQVVGNEDQIRRVFYNLIENAIKYTPCGGRVEVLLRPGPNETPCACWCAIPGLGFRPSTCRACSNASTGRIPPNPARG